MLHFTVPEHQFDEAITLEKKEGIFCDGSDRFDIAVAFSGKNTGFGSIKAGGNWIRSFGLHYYPLGQMENYGIDREDATLKDVKVVQEKDTFNIAGWTRLVRGEVWVEMQLIRSNVVDLYFRIENFGEIPPLALALFISADSILVGDQEIRSGTLNRFRGETKSITCKTGIETLQIIPHSSTIIQIIPLAGKNHFWGAGFLAAFEITDFHSRFHLKLL